MLSNTVFLHLNITRISFMKELYETANFHFVFNQNEDELNNDLQTKYEKEILTWCRKIEEPCLTRTEG